MSGKYDKLKWAILLTLFFITCFLPFNSLYQRLPLPPFKSNQTVNSGCIPLETPLETTDRKHTTNQYSKKCLSYAAFPGENRKAPGRLLNGILQCNDLHPYQIYKTENVQTFQQVVEYELWTTSAFLDERQVRGRITIISLSSYSLNKKNMHCTVWYDKCKRSVSMKAGERAMNHWAPIQKPFKHLGYFFFCDTKSSEVPDYVSLSTKPCDNPGNVLEVTKLVPYSGPTTIAHCLPTLHGVYNPYKLLEWIAFQRVQGVDHIFVYDFHSISRDVYRVLDYYARDGFVTIVRWHVQDMIAVRAFAHRTMLNDCAYKAYGRFKFVSQHDMDEFIVPIKSPSLKALVDQHSKKGSNHFILNNAHFCMSRSDVSAADADLRMLRLTRRKNPRGAELQKLVFAPEISFEIGIHAVEHMAMGSHTHRFGMNEAYIHHYRFWSEGTSRCNIEDKSATKFEKQVTEEFNRVRKALKL